MIRGIERRKIFRDNEDRDNFIDRLSTLIPETKTQCYAWAFMPNHIHLLIRSGPSGISTFMRRLLTGYAVYFNRRHKRHGQLFQNRYKSIICQEDAYLQELVRYIHLNPVRAKIIEDMDELDKYPYSGHSPVMGKVKREWQDIEYVLSYFGKNRGIARKRYRLYVEEGISMGRRPELIGGGLIRSMGGWGEVKKMRLRGQDRIKSDQRILGGSDFVLTVLSDAEENFTEKYALSSRGYDFEKVVERVSSIFKLEKDYITGKGRQEDRVKGRDLICYWCNNKLGIPMAGLSRRLGLTIAAVSFAVRRGEKIAKDGKYSLEI
jgi:REP element-mobilizing transposase RayT